MNVFPTINVELNKNYSISTDQINQIPRLSPETLRIVSAALGNQRPDLSKPESMDAVANKVDNIKSVCEKLAKAKESSKRDKIISVLLTALGLALLAATILCIVPNLSIAVVPLAFVCFFYNCFLNSYYLDYLGIEAGNTIAVYSALTPITYFIPIWTTFKKINRIESELHDHTKALTEDLKKTLPAQIEYYEKNRAEITKVLEEYLKLAEQTYTNAKNAPLQLEESILRSEKEFHAATAALKEIRNASEFYKTLSPPKLSKERS